MLNPVNRQPLPASSQQVGETSNRNNTAANQNVGQADIAHTSVNIPQRSLHTRSTRLPSASEIGRLFSSLRIFGRRQQQQNTSQVPISAPAKDTREAELRAEVKASMQGKAILMVEPAVRGISAARSNATKGLAEERSSKEVLSFLESGDLGVRKGTTAIETLKSRLSFATLSEADKQKFPADSLATLEQQSTQITKMADTISNATFLDGKNDFLQLGDGRKEKSPYLEMMDKHPEQDQAMRAWIKDGLNLGSEIINAQMQVLIDGRPLSETHIDGLQHRVNIFASLEKDMPDPINISEQSGVGSFADELIHKETEI